MYVKGVERMDDKNKEIKQKRRMEFSASKKGHSASKITFSKPIVVMQSSCCAMVTIPKSS